MPEDMLPEARRIITDGQFYGELYLVNNELTDDFPPSMQNVQMDTHTLWEK